METEKQNSEQTENTEEQSGVEEKQPQVIEEQLEVEAVEEVVEEQPEVTKNEEEQPVAIVEKAPKVVEKVSEEQTDFVTYKDFSKFDLRIAKILEAQRVPKSEKLIKLQINLGEALGERQIVAGIGKQYEPEELVGRKIVVVANLKPAKLMGLESKGMLLAASDEGQTHLALLGVDPLTPVGTKVS
jgi:methionyl-tRNA synthetase